MDNANRLLSYYRISLADADRLDPPATEVKDKGLHLDELRSLQESEVRKLFSGGASNAADTLEVSIAPIRCVSRRKGHFGRIVYPYWIPATLVNDGSFLPPRGATAIPWLTRGVLEPNDFLSADYPVVCGIAHSDTVSRNADIACGSWEEYWRDCEKYFRNLSGVSYRDFVVDDWDVHLDIVTIIRAANRGFSASIQRVYDEFMESGHWAHGALPVICQEHGAEQEHIHDELSVLTRSGHYGQMGNEFPLSPSQRMSLTLSELESGPNVLAVNGPPGTGKTTLLQSICANVVVKTVIEGERCPTLLACSTNNQAITNILDSFARVGPSSGHSNLHCRWLPDAGSFGMYLSSSDQRKLEDAEQKGYRVSTRGFQDRDGYRDYIEQHPRIDCEDYFLSRFRSAGGSKVVTAPQAVKELKNQLHRICSEIDTYIGHASLLVKTARDVGIDPENLAAVQEELQARKEGAKSDADLLSLLISEFRVPGATWGLFRRLVNLALRGGSKRVALITERLRERPHLLPKDLSPGFRVFAASLHEQRRNRDEEAVRLDDLIATFGEARGAVEAALKQLDTLLTERNLTLDEDQRSIYERLHIWLDLGKRCDAFWTALHWIEGNWIAHRNDEHYRKLNKGDRQSRERFRIVSHLSPLLVSTFHMVPNFFSYYKLLPNGDFVQKMLTEVADLLIVDEAGQVSPEIGVPAFAQAKRAIVVGDTLQIEPIWGVACEGIDAANAHASGIVSTKEEYDRFRDLRLSSMNGSLMSLAQHVSQVRYPADSPVGGTMLREHRRCVPQIAEFFNRFVYGGLLNVKTAARSKSGLPALGYYHVPGIHQKRSGSNENPTEAAAIARWVAENAEALCEEYGSDDIGEILGIVTPFRSQISAIRTCLEQENLDPKTITVGTVHALQGAERQIIIFSPVYGKGFADRQLFFDGDPNMLNVAVSRAKHHFFVFGYMPLFNRPQSETPRALLGRLLLADEANELVNSSYFEQRERELHDAYPAGDESQAQAVVSRISDLDHHRRSLEYAFKICERRLIIVSPFISAAAVRADAVDQRIRELCEKGAEVFIYTDAFLDRSRGELKAHAREGREILEASGARLIISEGIHNKTIVIDDSIILDGSFNWLSAVRDASSPFARREATIVVRPPLSDTMIHEVLDELKLSPTPLDS